MFCGCFARYHCWVALRKESVDRNITLLIMSMMPSMSLSARRAWIEILVVPGYKSFRNSVALRKESVDRNIHESGFHYSDLSSLSARRAWIEMFF